jgi:hypothetical protein
VFGKITCLSKEFMDVLELNSGQRSKETARVVGLSGRKLRCKHGGSQSKLSPAVGIVNV